MQRHEWKFPYTVAKLREAAEAKTAFHTGRKEWWENKRNESVEKLRATGIEINESIVERESKIGYNSTLRNRPGVSVELNQELVDDIDECTGKIAEHKAKVKDYNGWAQAFAAQPQDRQLELNQDDWLYFFGK